jgi:hypothetical protein
MSTLIDAKAVAFRRALSYYLQSATCVAAEVSNGKTMNSTPDKPPSPAASHATAAAPEDLIGEQLLTYEVAGDGNWFRMRFICANGKPGSLSLPTECLHALIMTLPKMMTQAFSARYGDDSLRLVYPADAVRIERSPDRNTFIMTLVTPDGFAVSFSLSKQQLRALSESGMNA